MNSKISFGKSPWGLILIASACIAVMAGDAAAQSESMMLRGGGATFPAPLYQRWIEAYAGQHPWSRIGYAKLGSGEGVQRFLAEKLDFAGSDAALDDEQMAQVKRGVRLVPATAGLIVLAYHVKGLTGPLKLPREVYRDIFSGKISRWNDARIKAANPDLNLPNQSITLVARLDGSGTTYAFTNHLSAISREWRDNGPGAGMTVAWPGNAMLVHGNEAVASRIKVSEGTIGYLEYGFAKRLGLPMAWLENKAGHFEEPNEQTGVEALAGNALQMPDNLRLMIPDPEGADAYPILTLSWLLLYQRYPDTEKASAIKQFVTFGLTEGQRYSHELGYIPLPADIVSRSRQALDSIR
ncbi:phosphate ABC transporter substrate-binding protein PstS [Candidatus Methylospira mobilis]|uniref:Phosphate-binding protein PstS n=1 Tax=Candidatus Methylospira mobilis TaxID=1808979 RepID=A0A5Q0BBH6_9GAMM|nr:phosphate ABC transporter substrate-binding protein PstS [Candidatus Methylospira mobilis]QFY41303.1 phosphate ABC transporter substrate-binding protein PstS [Candidatus Methylospira mobilis]WNV05475.1 phosphate ABC transporter substrate-binding protein PstS [Candidatus Methylospira mobilis]